MRAVILLFAATLIQTPQAPNPQQGVVDRGDHVMGFSHDKTAHHFQIIDHQTGDSPSIRSESQK